MRKIGAKLLSALIAIVMVVGLLPLGHTVYARDDQVANLRWNGNTAEWDHYSSATKYYVRLDVVVNTSTYTTIFIDETSNNFLDFTDYLLPGNTYEVAVEPLFGDAYDPSDESTYGKWSYKQKTVSGSHSSVSNIVINADNRSATWDIISDATGYDVWILKNGAQIGTVRNCNTNSIDFSNDVTISGSGNYRIKVRAYKLSRGNYLAEGESQEVTITSHKITVYNDGNGTAVASLPTAATGTVITLNSTPNTGYQFKEWQVISGGINITEDKFIMGSSDVEIRAIFQEEPELHFTVQPQNGIANNGEDYTFVWDTDISFPSYAQCLIQRYISESETTNYDVFSASPATIQWWGGARDTTQRFRLVISYHGKDYYSNDFTVSWGNAATTTYDVVFNSNGHGTAPDTQNIISGGTATKPMDPAETGWVFEGWYTEPSCENEFDFETPITSSLVLYAKWTIDSELHFTTQPVSGSVINNGEDYVFVWGTDAYGAYDECTIQRYVSESETVDQSTISLSPATIEWWEGARNTTQRFRIHISYHGKDYYSNDFTVAWEELITPTAPIIATSTLSDGMVNMPYNQTLLATGDTPITWSLYSGSLPAGLTLGTDGTISGTPNTAGDYTFTVKATNTAGDDTKQFTITIAPADAVTYTVTFNANGHGTAPAALPVTSGSTASKPADPTASGWTFGGWYQDATCSVAFDFATPITANITLYAKWTEDSVTPITHSVSFETNGGSAVVAQTIEDGEKATKPTDPTKEGFVFDGWYQDATLSVVFSFDTPITADITLYAKWTEDTPSTVYYTVVGGGNSSFTAGNASDLVVTVKRSEADETCFSHFTGVQIDGVVLVNGTDYTAVAGSTVVTIKKETLNNLSEGGHTITVLFDDGKTETSVTAKAAGTNNNSDSNGNKAIPATGESLAPTLFVGIAFVAVAGMIFAVILVQKKRKSVQR